MKRLELAGYRNLFTGYTELRVQENRNISISLVDGTVMGNSRTSESGVSARSFRRGSWGFASSPEFSDDALRHVIGLSARNAEFLDEKESRGRGELPSSAGCGQWDFTTRKPAMNQRNMIEFLREVDGYMEKNFKKLISRTVVLNSLDMEKQLLTSTGSEAWSMIPRTMLYALMTVDSDSGPVDLYDVMGGLGQTEDILTEPSLFFPKLDSLYEHLLMKSEGIYPAAGIKDCILDADLAGILSHEAIGHTTEADIVRGGSVAANFMDQQVASPLVTLIDYANTAMGEVCPVPVYVDDEGTPARDAAIIHRGVLKSYLHNRESALEHGVEPTGNARGYRFSDEPLIRMRNTAIVPGTSTLDDMIGSIDHGYYLMKSSNGQADSTSEFMFGVVLGYEIKNGKLGKALKDITISGVAFDVLKTVTAVSNDMKWTSGGMCGKKQPIPVGMGGPAVKCRVNIGGR